MLLVAIVPRLFLASTVIVWTPDDNVTAIWLLEVQLEKLPESTFAQYETAPDAFITTVKEPPLVMQVAPLRPVTPVIVGVIADASADNP